MSNLNRRVFASRLIAVFSVTCISIPTAIAQLLKPSNTPTLEPANRDVDDWMKGWMETKSIGDPLVVQRFVEPIYFLIKPIQWRPADSSSKLKEVNVPAGFVTDLASIPAVFWSVLRPDGDYAYAAIVHDYLYWTQSLTRDESDEILKLAMADLDVSTLKAWAISTAVGVFGNGAWKRNAELKANGEKRILKRFPTVGVTRWEAWKKEPDVF